MQCIIHNTMEEMDTLCRDHWYSRILPACHDYFIKLLVFIVLISMAWGYYLLRIWWNCCKSLNNSLTNWRIAVKKGQRYVSPTILAMWNKLWKTTLSMIILYHNYALFYLFTAISLAGGKFHVLGKATVVEKIRID